MAEHIHDDEADTSERQVGSLLIDQCPELSGLPISYLRTSGTDNAMWRIHVRDGRDLVVRLPRTARAGESMENELALLPSLAKRSLHVATPTVRCAGLPSESFPHRWAVLDWIDGDDAWNCRLDAAANTDDLACDVARTVRAIGRQEHLPAPPRPDGDRGGPLGPLLARLEQWLDDPDLSADQLLDTAAIRRIAAQSAEVADDAIELGFTHGDLIPGNLLIKNRRLAGVIDWGGAAYADPAQDLAPAWAVLDSRARRIFRDEVEADDAAWLRGRAFALEQAVGAILYYQPRKHPLADVMARTLHQILEDG